MKRYLLIIFSLIVAYFTNAQITRLELTELGVFTKENFSQANVYFNQEVQLKAIIIDKTRTNKVRQIWRIRIYMGSGRNARATATSTRNSFVAKYPDISADIVYPSPYFKVQVGEFKTRIEAESFMKKIEGEYHKCRVEPVTLGND